MRANCPRLINIHCVAHRLALAAAQSAAGIPYLTKFKDILGQMYRYYEASGVRMAGLKAIQVNRTRTI